jgi:hypothetical protein
LMTKKEKYFIILFKKEGKEELFLEATEIQ